MSDIDGRLNQANGRLKSAKVGVSILKIGNRLYLQATLPPRPTSHKLVKHQQKIALNVYANPAGINAAEKEARKVGALLGRVCKLTTRKKEDRSANPLLFWGGLSRGRMSKSLHSLASL